MEFFRIILVDDEAEVRDSIKNKIDWEALGFQLAGDAENGQDALEMLENLDPDVVLTDIKMPYMDGLTLAARIRDYNPSIRIVLFSGFDEFEYAKQAIRLNVIEYILKPVNVEELTEILRGIHKTLQEELEQKRNVEILRTNFRRNLPYLQDHFLNELVHGRVEENAIGGELRYYGIDIADADCWVTAGLVIEGGTSQEVLEYIPVWKEKELVLLSVRQITEECILADLRYAMFRGSQGWYLIAALKGPRQLPDLIKNLQYICKECRRILKADVTIGVSQICRKPGGLREAYAECKEALGYRVIMGTGQVIYSKDVEPVQKEYLEFDSKMEGKLISAVKFGCADQIRESVGEIVENMNGVKAHSSDYQFYTLQILNSVSKMLKRFGLDTAEVLGKGKDCAELLLELTGRKELFGWLADTSIRISEIIHDERRHTTQNLIDMAKEYIQEHYPNPDLTVETVCNYLHISQSYFFSLFKKETGQSFVTYLTEVRLQKALELLNQTEDKTYLIAEKVGYTEPNYFSYVFKKKFGISPTKYRGRGSL